MNDALTGGCLCGAIRYAIGRIFDAGYCHCSRCRRNTGAPVLAWARVEAEAFRVLRGSPRAWVSSALGNRCFCDGCGSALWFEDRDRQYYSVGIGTLDEPERVRPTVHICVESQLPWLDLADDLPRFTGNTLPHPASRRPPQTPVRAAAASDVPAIRRLMESVPGFWQPDWSEATIVTALRAARGLAFVHEEPAGIVGFACAHELGFRAYLSELVVAEGHRRRGIGRGLLDRITDELQHRGVGPLIADVWRDALPFYRSRGWTAPDAVLLRHPAARAATRRP